MDLYPIAITAALPPGAEYYANYAAFKVINPGESLPDFANVPIKRWRIKGLPAKQNVTFKYASHDLTIQTMTMTGAEAASLNLPGLRTVYQKYVEWLAARPKSTSTVTFSFFGSGFTRLVETDDNVTVLFTPAEVTTFAALALPKGWTTEEAPPPSPSATFNWADDRRVFNVVAPNGQKYSFGHMFRDASMVKGVGAPGAFVAVDATPASTSGAPAVWVPVAVPTGEFESREIPPPLRDLLPSEKLQSTLDMTLEIVLEGTPLSGDAPTAVDPAMMGVCQETLKRVTQMQLKIDKLVG